jgi:hypothetical protein
VGRIDETAYPFASNSRLAPRASQSVWPSQYTRRGRWAIVDAIEVTRTSSGEWWLGSVQGSASEVGSTGVSAAAVADKPRQARTETAATTDRHPSMCLGDTRRPPLPNRAALLRSSCLARLKAFSLLDPAASTSVQLSGRDTVVPVDEALWPVDEALWSAEQVGHLASDSTRRRLTRFSTGGGASPANFTWPERESAPAVPPRSREQDGGEVGIECAVEGGSTGKLARMACADGHVRKGDYRSAARSPTLRRGRSKRAREEASERAGRFDPALRPAPFVAAGELVA